MHPRRRGETTGASARPTLRHLSAAALLCAGLALPSAIATTDATWTDPESASSTLTAATIPPPVLTAACRFVPGLLGLGARVEIYWRLPSGYQLSNVVTSASTSGLGSVLAPLTGFNLTSNTTLLADGTYRTNVATNLLGGLLGLGTELEITLSIKDPNGWTSRTAAVATNAGLIAGLGGSCRNLT